MGRKAKLDMPGWESTRGSNSRTSKLNEEKVMEIKKRLSDGDSIVSIAADYDVSWSCVKDISTGYRWRHVACPE